MKCEDSILQDKQKICPAKAEATDQMPRVLDNITFCGTSLDDFHLEDEGQYGAASRKFSLLKWGGHNSGSLEFPVAPPYLYDLQGYELEAEIPISVFRKRDKMG